jgi:hypothetical protein
VDRDPFFAYANFHLGNALYLAGQFEEAEPRLPDDTLLESADVGGDIGQFGHLGRLFDSARDRRRANRHYSRIMQVMTPIRPSGGAAHNAQ